MVRFSISAFLLAVSLAGAARLAYPQMAVQTGTTSAKDQFFTGIVTAIDENKLTVNRMVLGKNSATKTFLVTAETKFEGGMPRVRAQVTVRYVATDEGDTAVTVILRRSPK
jgi:hypothetical protein